MKYLFRISFLLILSVTIGSSTAYATENDSNGDNKTQPNIEQTGDEENKSQETDDEGVSAFDGAQFVKDSTEDDSVNKYNFIFYFLYKFKYDHEESL